MEDLAAHIASIAARGRGGDRRLAAALLQRAWPGGSADRTRPAAREWVRRWGPGATAPGTPSCSCAAGRCALCN